MIDEAAEKAGNEACVRTRCARPEKMSRYSARLSPFKITSTSTMKLLRLHKNRSERTRGSLSAQAGKKGIKSHISNSGSFHTKYRRSLSKSEVGFNNVLEVC